MRKDGLKRTSYSCIEKCHYCEYNPIKHIERWGRSIKRCYQRIKYGYCDSDVWSIDWWFLSVVPNMIEDLSRTTHGYPCAPGSVSNAIIGTGAPEEVDKAGMQDWQSILKEMVILFREAHEETCTRKNKYEEEYDRARREFETKYGEFGEKLRTEEEIAEERAKGIHRWYMPSDVPEYKEISELYYEESQAIDKYRDECKNKGLELFSKWFWNLWD